MNLTKPQKLIYDMEKFVGGSISVICGSMLIKGSKDISKLKASVNELYRLNDALRICIKKRDIKVEQNIIEFTEKEIEIISFDDKGELDAYGETWAKVPIDIYGSLCEIKVVLLPDSYGIIIKLHHLIGDAWTLSLLGSQFNAVINGEIPQAYSYIEYIESENNYLKSSSYSKDKDFFVEQLEKCEELTYISEKRTKIFESKRKKFVIEADRAKVIKDYITEHETSSFMLFTAIFAIYINRIKTNAEKFYIGTAVLNRNGSKEKKTAGMFINTVPMLIELDNSVDFRSNLLYIKNTVFSVLRHQKYNYGDILNTIRKEYNFTEKLYDVVLNYQNASISAGNDTNSTWYHCGMQSESLQIHIGDYDNKGVYKIQYDYQIEKFSEREIEALHAHVMNLLFDSIHNDDKKLYELCILTKEEQQKLFFDFNDTIADYPKGRCIHTLFEEQVEKIPNKAAVITCDKVLTYAELNGQANRISQSLINKGIGAGDIAAFALSRKSSLIITILGILKSGAAYLPIDPDYPQDRIDYMLSDSNAKIYITENMIEELLESNNTRNPDVVMSDDNLCYCIYTSGSTGMPKGTLVRIGNFINTILWRIQNYDLTSVLSISSVTTDTFQEELFSALLSGSLMYFVHNRKNLEEIAEIIELEKDISVMTTPTYFKTIGKNINIEKFAQIILVGENIDANLAEQILDHNCLMHNEYGPSECTVCAAYKHITTNNITIGKPIANTQIYIVDKYMNLLPIGATGELCIAGAGVGAGYLNRPELTAERFIDNPFGEGKLYKTGDLAYWREDGDIVYVGRNDFQVKIRGRRIELGEIEHAVLSVERIHQAVVVVRENIEGRKIICAFYTGDMVNAKDIRRYISKRLPKYMLPHIFVHLSEMPLTSSGKINRKMLPEVDLRNIEVMTEYVKPKTQVQNELCHLIERILGITSVGIKDDFFDIGGDSLNAIEYVSMAHNEGIYFNLQNVFDYPTVKQLCDYLENSDKQAVTFTDDDFSKADRILAKNTVENIVVSRKCEVGNILLAGATGYLGIHILADYFDNDSGTAYCLVRGRTQEDSEKRMAEWLKFYFGDKYAECGRIKVICADLQKDLFGLLQEEYEVLLSKVQTVINAAASVKHYGSYKYFYEVNVEATMRLIDFCKQANAKLIHISTLSVSGNMFSDVFESNASGTKKYFYESSLYIGQPLSNVYGRSKFEAEKAVLDAMAGGLHANIMRMGNLTNRYSDGVFQRNHESNAFLKRMKALLDIGIFPDYLSNLYVEFTPIDIAANAVMTIVRYFTTEKTVFHINNIKEIYFNRILEYFNAFGFGVKIVTGKEFTDALHEAAMQSSKRHIFEAFINDMDENDQLNYDSNIIIESDFTVQYLKLLGFEWPDIGLEYFQKYIDYFRKIDFLR